MEWIVSGIALGAAAGFLLGEYLVLAELKKVLGDLGIPFPVAGRKGQGGEAFLVGPEGQVVQLPHQTDLERMILVLRKLARSQN